MSARFSNEGGANQGMHTHLLAAAFREQAPLYAELIRQGCDEGIFHTD